MPEKRPADPPRVDGPEAWDATELAQLHEGLQRFAVSRGDANLVAVGLGVKERGGRRVRRPILAARFYVRRKATRLARGRRLPACISLTIQSRHGRRVTVDLPSVVEAVGGEFVRTGSPLRGGQAAMTGATMVWQTDPDRVSDASHWGLLTVGHICPAAREGEIIVERQEWGPHSPREISGSVLHCASTDDPYDALGISTDARRDGGLAHG